MASLFMTSSFENQPSSQLHEQCERLEIRLPAETQKIKLLCRTQLDFSQCSVNLGLFARSQNLFQEASILFQKQHILNEAEKYILYNNEVSMSVCDIFMSVCDQFDKKLTHGQIIRGGKTGVFNEVHKKFVKKMQVLQLHDLKEIFYDSISPLIRNPFRYYFQYAMNIIHTNAIQEHALTILYPSVHKEAIIELFVWYLTFKNKSEVIPFMSKIVIDDIHSVCWSVACTSVLVIIDFGFELIDFAKLGVLTSNNALGWLVANPFDYIICYARDTCFKDCRVHDQIAQDTIVYKGEFISLSTECEFVTRCFDLSTQNHSLTFKDLSQFMQHLYTSPLSQSEFQNVISHFSDCDEYQDEELCFEKASYVSSIYNHHNVVGFVEKSPGVFVCKVEEYS